jgi:hypothetical protein
MHACPGRHTRSYSRTHRHGAARTRAAYLHICKGEVTQFGPPYIVSVVSALDHIKLNNMYICDLEVKQHIIMYTINYDNYVISNAL